MPVQRFAGQQPDVKSAMRAFMANRDVQIPAYEIGDDNEFRLTSQGEQVIGELSRISGGKAVNIRPANSVDAMEGRPMWGSGNGVAYSSADPSRGFYGIVDPLNGSVHTLAHEGGHVVAPSSLRRHEDSFATMSPLSVPRESGARLRFVHNEVGSHVVGEEAHAMGIEDQVMENLGFPQSRDLGGKSLRYPLSYAGAGLDFYGMAEQGPMSPNERAEARRILRGAQPFAERLYRMGRERAR